MLWSGIGDSTYSKKSKICAGIWKAWCKSREVHQAACRQQSQDGTAIRLWCGLRAILRARALFSAKSLLFKSFNSIASGVSQLRYAWHIMSMKQLCLVVLSSKQRPIDLLTELRMRLSMGAWSMYAADDGRGDSEMSNWHKESFIQQRCAQRECSMTPCWFHLLHKITHALFSYARPRNEMLILWPALQPCSSLLELPAWLCLILSKWLDICSWYIKRGARMQDTIGPLSSCKTDGSFQPLLLLRLT